MASVTDQGDYTLVEVSSGETWVKQVDSGSTWQNVLIDITASGAAYRIIATGTNWTIRNIGVRGTFDTMTNDSRFNVYDPDSNGESLIENCYFPGAGTTGHNYDGPVGLWVGPDHAGHVTIRNINMQYMQDNGIYASAPGNGSTHPSPGKNGTVYIEDSFFRGNATAHTRLGSDGSHVKNCVAIDGLHRGHWQYYNKSELIDCDYGGNGSQDIRLGGSSWPGQSSASVKVTNTRYNTVEDQGGTIEGSSAGEPRRNQPDQVDGVPLSAKEAASGSSSGSNDVALGATTGPVENVTDTAATLTADLDGLGGSPNADVYFEYRKIGQTDVSDTSPSPQEYDTITVGAGETFTKRLGDGDTWQNKLIDVSADGAGYDIRAVGDNWTIRNIGVTGPMDVQGGRNTDFICRVNSPDATGLIENIYLGYETTFSRSQSTSPMGLFVHAYHEGDLEINDFYCTDMPSHSIYGSGPGNGSSHPNPGGGGTVRIHDSYAADLENSGFRIGTTGSYIDNCVAFRTVRGLWAYYEDIEVYNSHLGDNTTDIVVGSGSWPKSASVTVDDNTYYETIERPDGTFSGSSAGTPQEFVPDSCPTSAKDAAQGL